MIHSVRVWVCVWGWGIRVERTNEKAGLSRNKSVAPWRGELCFWEGDERGGGGGGVAREGRRGEEVVRGGGSPESHRKSEEEEEEGEKERERISMRGSGKTKKKKPTRHPHRQATHRLY